MTMSQHLSPSLKPTTWWPSASSLPTLKTPETVSAWWPTPSHSPTVSPFPSYFETETKEDNEDDTYYYYYYYYYEDDTLSDHPTSSPSSSSWWPTSSTPTLSPFPTYVNTEKLDVAQIKSSEQRNELLENEKIVFKNSKHISLDEIENGEISSISNLSPSAGMKKTANSISLDDISSPSVPQTSTKNPTISPFPSSSSTPTVSPFPSSSSTPTVSPFPSSKDTSTVSPFPSSSSTPTISPFPSSNTFLPSYYYYYYYYDDTNMPSNSPTISQTEIQTVTTPTKPHGTNIGNDEDVNFVRICNEYVLNKKMFKTTDRPVAFFFQVEHGSFDEGKDFWNNLAINLLDIVAESTLTCYQGKNPRNIRHRMTLENEEKAIFAVSIPSEGFFMHLGKCEKDNIDGKQCEIVRGEMVVTTLPLAFDEARLNMLQTIKEAMNGDKLASTDPNIIKTEYVGPVFTKLVSSEKIVQRSSKFGMIFFSSAFVVSLMGSIFMIYRHRSRSGGKFSLPKTIGPEVEFCFEDNKHDSNDDNNELITSEGRHIEAAEFALVDRIFTKQEPPEPTIAKDYSQEQIFHRNRRPRQVFEKVVEDELATKSDESGETLRTSWKTTHKDAGDLIPSQNVSSSSRSHFDALKRSERHYEGNTYEMDLRGKYENISNRSTTPERESYKRERARYTSSRYKERYSDDTRSKLTDSRRSYRSVSPRKEYKHRHSDFDSDDRSTNDVLIRPSRSYSPINSHKYNMDSDKRGKQEDMLFSSLGIQSSPKTPPRKRSTRIRENYTSSSHRVSFNDDDNLRRGSYRALPSVGTPSTADESSDSLSPGRIRRSSYRRHRLSD